MRALEIPGCPLCESIRRVWPRSECERHRLPKRVAKGYRIVELPNLQAVRRRLGVSQEELAHAIGVHQPNISRVESGGHAVRLSMASAIAEELEVSLKELTGEEDYE